MSTFRSKTLTKSENDCVNHCATNFLKMSKRVGERFAEIQLQQQSEAMMQAQAQNHQ